MKSYSTNRDRKYSAKLPYERRQLQDETTRKLKHKNDWIFLYIIRRKDESALRKEMDV